VLVVSLAACGGTHAKVGAPPKATRAQVDVRLREWRISPALDRVPAGRVTFVVHNDGRLEHELVVIRTDRSPSALPVDNGEASESGSRGEIDGVPPGRTGRVTLTLAPGRYALICNRSDHGGHYEEGMFAALRVT